MAISGAQIIRDLEEALSLDNEDQFIIYQNSTGRSKRVKRGNLFLSRGIRVTGKFIDSETGNDVGIASSTALNNAATALVSATGAQASADGKNKVYYSATEPSLASITGYINNTTLTVNSVTGIPIYVGMPLIRASAPAVTTGTKVSAFLGTSGGQAGQYTVSISQTAGSAGSPISITGGDFENGDIWYDIDDNYKQYVRNGSIWQASFAPMIRFGSSGKISGLLRADQYGGTSDMDFVLVADNFQIWNGTSAEVPFEVRTITSGTSGQQVVRIKNAQIQNVDAGKITAGFLGAQVIDINGSSATGTSGAAGYIESTNFVPTWVSGVMTVRQYMTTGAYGAFLGKQSPSDVVQVKIAQNDGSYKLFRSKQDQGSSGATNAPISTGGTNAYWEEVSAPTFNVQIGDETKSIQNLGFRITSNGFNEFNGALFRGAVIANEGFFGNTKNAVRLDSSGLTIGNYGYLKSRGIGYNGTEFFATSGTSGGFFLGNTQAEGQADLYQLFVGKPLGNSLWWNGSSLLVNGNLVAESASGSSGAGLTINSGFGIRYKENNAVLTVTGGAQNGHTSGAQIDLAGTQYSNVNRGALVLSAGYLNPWPSPSDINSGAIHFRTGNSLVGLWRSDKTFDIYSSVRMSGVVYAGSADPAVAPFRISTSGVLTATAAILQAAVISGSSAISGDTDVGGRLAAMLADAIDGNGNLITNVLNSKLNTQSAQILDSFSFGTSGAIQIGSYTSGGTSGDIKISPNGIVGRNSAGDTTFALNGVTGSATFAGQVTALSGNIGGWIINPSNLSKNNATISSTGVITLGSGGESVILSSVDPDNRIWVGNATSALAPFRVSRTGTVTAEDIKLAGGEVTGTFNIKSGGFLFFGTGGANGGSLAMSSSYVRAFSFDSSGNGSVTFGVNLLNGVGNIGGWTFNRNSLFAGTSGSRVGLESDSTSGNVVIYAGSETKASAPFRVTNTGILNATGATISGALTANSGFIGGTGGFEIVSNYIRKGTKAGYDSSGTGVYIGIDGIGLGTSFLASSTGQVTASSGTIGGWTLAASKLSAGGIDIDSTPNGSAIGATLIAANETYSITTLGNTNFTLIGAKTNTIGEVFVATGAGTGTGTATKVAQKIQVGTGAGNFVRIDSGGITGVSGILGSTFVLPTNGGRPKFSSGDITLTNYVVSSQGVIRTSDTVGNGTTGSAGVLINDQGIRGYGENQALNNPSFHLNSNGTFTLGTSAGANFLSWNGSALSIKGSITLVNTIPSTSVSGLGALATQNSVSYGSITGTKPPENADVTLTAIQGSLTLTGGGLVLSSGGASIRGGQTGFNTGIGFWVGDVSGTTKFSIGNSTSGRMTWDGSALSVVGNITATSLTLSGATVPAASVTGLTGSSVGLGNVQNLNAAGQTTSGLESTISINTGGISMGTGGFVRGGIEWDSGNTRFTGASGFFLGYGSSQYRFFIGSTGNPGVGSGNYLYWDGSGLKIGGTLEARSSGNNASGAGITINSGYGIRYGNANSVLTINGGDGNGVQYGAQIDLIGAEYNTASDSPGAGNGRLTLQASYKRTASFDNPNDGSILLCTSYKQTTNSADQGVPRVIIELDGTVRIMSEASSVPPGGSTPAPNDGAGQLVVDTSINSPHIFFGNGSLTSMSVNNNFGANNCLTFAGGTGDGNLSAFRWVNSGNNLQLASLSTSGDLRASSFISTSSIKYKKKIKNYKKGLEIVKKLNPVSFTRKIDKKSDIGLIAEDVDQILSTIVQRGEKNEIEGLDYSKLTVVLINAVKELSLEVERLKNKIK